MTCHDVQNDFSLYLYGELDFAREEAVEQHLAACAYCQHALAREKKWHTMVNGERKDIPFQLLNECRRELKRSIQAEEVSSKPSVPVWRRFLNVLEISGTQWAVRSAAASLLLILGFGAGRWVDRNGLPGVQNTNGPAEMSLFGPDTHVRDVRTSDGGQIRIVVDQVRQGEITGPLDDGRVRRLLLAATRDPENPAVRVDSVEILNGQAGSDVRDALLFSIRHDPNAAVRIKALEGLRRFSGDNVTRQALKYVLEHDENPGVRSEAIDVLAPADGNVQITPEFVNTLQDVMRTQTSDEYVRMRCLQILQDMKTSLDSTY